MSTHSNSINAPGSVRAVSPGAAVEPMTNSKTQAVGEKMSDALLKSLIGSLSKADVSRNSGKQPDGVGRPMHPYYLAKQGEDVVVDVKHISDKEYTQFVYTTDDWATKHWLYDARYDPGEGVFNLGQFKPGTKVQLGSLSSNGYFLGDIPKHNLSDDSISHERAVQTPGGGTLIGFEQGIKDTNDGSYNDAVAEMRGKIAGEETLKTKCIFADDDPVTGQIKRA